MQKEQMKIIDKMTMGVGKGEHEQIKINANMKLELFDANGNLKATRNVKNTVTTATKYGIMDQILASPTLTAKPGWMELGTGSPAATLLGAYISGSRTALDSKTRSGAVVTMVCTFGAGVGTGAVTEAGVFDVVTQNTVNMWMSTSFSVVNKAADDSLVITWTLTLS
ncbi:MAG: hypothetical protein PHV90_00330 [Smithella sp.]|nr:hypothetical protein [Smithella sp.]